MSTVRRLGKISQVALKAEKADFQKTLQYMNKTPLAILGGNRLRLPPPPEFEAAEKVVHLVSFRAEDCFVALCHPKWKAIYLHI